MAGASTAVLIEQLAARVGPAGVRAATGEDAVDGVQPRLVAAPASVDALAATLAWASSEGLSVRVAGGGTKQDWGAAGAPVDLLLSTAALSSVVEHRHGDLTATVEAGTTLAAVNAALAAHGQRLPWDPPWPERATVGGIVATNDSGPRRHGHGAPRDSIIGVTVARSDGRVAKAGGIVVKNVAGYDLARLLTGSFGCLGVILTATFKLAPAPPASRTVEIGVDSLEDAAPIAADLAGSALTPTALEVAAAPVRLLVRFESVEASVVQQADEACTLVGRRGAAVVLGGEDEQAAWSRHDAHWSPGATLVKLSAVPAELFATLVWLRDRAAAEGLDMAAAGRAGLGVVDIRLNGPGDAQARLVGALRDRLPAGRGSAVVRRGEPELRSGIDAWGPIGDGMRVMMAVKRQFDPAGLLNPGRGPGGL
jgi:glycolate oxidase FAD binding subunit